MAELPSFSRASSSSCQGLEVIPPDEPSNQQCPESPSPRASSSSHAGYFSRIRSELIARECSNQQILPENVEVSVRPQPPLRVSRNRDRYERAEYGSIIIPVGGTLSRPSKKKHDAPECSISDSMATLRERNALMLLNEQMADVHFIVGSDNDVERIPAHSYVLSIASNPFNAMFHGGFERKSEIEVPDVEPAAFKALLKYLYTDEVDICSETALPILYVSKKYLINYLSRAAITFLEAHLNADNVCTLLSQSRLFEEEDLIKRCWELVDANAECVLRSESFQQIDFFLFEQIISRDTLIVKEKTVYEDTVRWATAECIRRQERVTSAKLREVLGDALYHIRFPAMTITDFANGPAKSDLLTCQETNNIFLHFAAEEKPRLPFPTKQRSGLPLQSCTRFQAALHGTNQWRYRGRCDSIQFLVDRRIFVAGFGLYGSSSGPSEYKVRMELKNGRDVLDSIETIFHSSGTSEAFPVLFEHPIQIDVDMKYTASIIMEGKELSHFGQEGMSEVCVMLNSEDGGMSDEGECVNFFFTPSTDSKNGTGVQGGQIPQILFYI